MLRKFVVTGAALVAVSGAGLWHDHAVERTHQEHQAYDNGALNRARLLPQSPGEAVTALYSLVGGHDSAACFLFTPAAGEQFARAAGTTDCPAAVAQLGARVANPGLFARPVVDSSGYGQHATANGCMGWRTPDGDEAPDPGPRLGILTLERELGQGYRITDYQPCAQTITTSAAPTTPRTTPVRLLPSYPPGFAGVLAAAIARRDITVCALFSQSGMQQFAAAVGADSCPEGVGVLAAKVSDPTRYADPSGATARNVAPGRSVVDACSLTWSTWGASSTPAGPQLGKLELEYQQDRGGYLLVGWQPCG